MQRIEMPSKLRQRPKFHGFPIPFTTFVGVDGVPDFKVVNEDNRMLCIQHRRCGLCGQDLSRTKECVFIGGEGSCTSGYFIDPAMHEECAIYATKVCPFLTGKRLNYSEDISPNTSIMYEVVANERPRRMGLYYCRGYSMVVVNGIICIKAGPAQKVDYSLMPEIDIPIRSPDVEPAPQPAALEASDFAPPVLPIGEQ